MQTVAKQRDKIICFEMHINRGMSEYIIEMSCWLSGLQCPHFLLSILPQCTVKLETEEI